MAEQLHSTVNIDGTEYEVVAKTAEKVAVPLTIKVVNGDTKEYTFDGSSDPAVEIKAVQEAGKLTHGLAVFEGKDATESSFVFDGSEANQSIRLLTPGDITISGTVTKEIGGIAKDKEYANAAIIDVLSDLLFPYVAPTFSSIALSETAGTFEYGTSRTISKVTPNFTKGSKNITSIKIGTTSDGSDLYSGTSATSGTAITLTTSKTFDGNTGGTIYCTISDGQQTASANASISYKYYDYSILSASTTAPASGATKQTSSGADNTYSYEAGQYLWLYSRSSGKKIQTYVAGSWADVTTVPSSGTIILTLASGATAPYYAYRTDKFTAKGQARYRLA